MKPVLQILPLLALSVASHAEQGRSIMFEDNAPVFTDQTRDTSSVDLAEHCKQLRRQMDELKGKPQRRNAVVQRYRLECVQPE